MEIKNHSTNKNYFVIYDPTDEALAEAKHLSQGNWAKIQANGSIVVHNNFRAKFLAVAEASAEASKVVPVFDSHDQMMEWLDENMNSAYAFRYFDQMRVKEFNARFSGRPLREAEEYGEACQRA